MEETQLNHFTTTILACGIMVAALPAARAADTTCPPNPGINATVNGNLIVPAGQTCALDAVTVTGNVQVQTNATLQYPFSVPSTIVGNVSVGTGASLIASEGFLTIDGNLAANQCHLVNLAGEPRPIIGGNVQIQFCTEGADVITSNIGGNLTCNNSSECTIGGNKINGNVEVNDNSSARVEFNTIGHNLECQGNTSITDDGAPNTVGGHKNGQCAGF
jgi:predicted acyltransferase (DUF342 family)